MDIELIFRRIGLAKHAHSVYETLRKEGPLLAAEIARSAGIHRPAVYAGLEDLIRNRFVVSVTTGKRIRYRAMNPGRILKKFSEISMEVTKTVLEALPQKEASSLDNIRFLSGQDGIRATFDDVIDHTPRGETFYRYTSEKDLGTVNSYLSSDYRTRRDQKRLERLVISNPKSGLQKRSRLERFVKYILPKDTLFEQNIIQVIYGERVAFIDLNTEQCIIIENRALADFQKIIFQQLYRKLN